MCNKDYDCIVRFVDKCIECDLRLDIMLVCNLLVGEKFYIDL